jgi:homocysteine S-methyltransferase
VKTLGELIEDQDVHVLDGAMGTLLYDRGVFVNVCYDELAISKPDLVERIHREYVVAGAEILETNTFGANPVKLSGFGLEARTEEINRAAAQVARRAASGRARVVGAIGPLGVRIEPWGPTSEKEAEGYFRRQATGLVEGGVEGFLLETFSDLNELHQALLAVRSVSDLPLFAQVTIEEGGATSYGTTAEAAAGALDSWGADVIGLNCSVGPAEILEAVERMAAVTKRPLVAQPNAGLPRLVGDRKMYLASPTHMARYAVRMVEAGVRFVGGCCGTTPQHIREIRAAVDGLRARTSSLTGRKKGARAGRGARASADQARPRRAPVRLSERSRLGAKLAAGEFVTSVEILPPRGWDAAAVVKEAAAAEKIGVDLVAVLDPVPGARRMGGVTAALLLGRGGKAGSGRARTGAGGARTGAGPDVLLHYTCRDRNMPRMVSELLGVAAGGVRNVLALSGDPSPIGPYPDHTTVLDLDSIGLINLIHRLNLGTDPGGQAVEPPTRFVIGVALNHGAADRDRQLARFRWKVEAGADFAVTRPVFDAKALFSFLEEAATRPVPVLAGVWPLTSLRDAEYLSQEVPGVRVPDTVLGRMEGAEKKGPGAAREEGLQIVREQLDLLVPRVQGIHVYGAGVDIGLKRTVVREVLARADALRRARGRPRRGGRSGAPRGRSTPGRGAGPREKKRAR